MKRKVLFGELSSQGVEVFGRGIVQSGNCMVGNSPVGELSGRGIVHSGKHPGWDLSVKICPSGNRPSGNCPSGSCPGFTMK